MEPRAGAAHEPHLWTPYQRDRRESFEARVADYRRRGLLD